MVAGPPTNGGLVAGDPADPCVYPAKRFCNVNVGRSCRASIVDRRGEVRDPTVVPAAGTGELAEEQGWAADGRGAAPHHQRRAPRGVPGQAGLLDHRRARRHRSARRRRLAVRRAAPPRQSPPLRLPPRGRRRPRQLGRPERSDARPGRATSGDAGRRSSAGLLRLRGGYRRRRVRGGGMSWCGIGGCGRSPKATIRWPRSPRAACTSRCSGRSCAVVSPSCAVAAIDERATSGCCSRSTMPTPFRVEP
jgi:hypothetical protein